MSILEYFEVLPYGLFRDSVDTPLSLNDEHVFGYSLSHNVNLIRYYDGLVRDEFHNHVKYNGKTITHNKSCEIIDNYIKLYNRKKKLERIL